ncbi:MAG: hypothetical protein AAF789_02240 [Bacteroidota bacterium]
MKYVKNLIFAFLSCCLWACSTSSDTKDTTENSPKKALSEQEIRQLKVDYYKSNGDSLFSQIAKIQRIFDSFSPSINPPADTSYKHDQPVSIYEIADDGGNFFAKAEGQVALIIRSESDGSKLSHGIVEKLSNCTSTGDFSPCYDIGYDVTNAVMACSIILIDHSIVFRQPEVEENSTGFRSGFVSRGVYCFDVASGIPFHQFNYFASNSQQVNFGSSTDMSDKTAVMTSLLNDLGTQLEYSHKAALLKYFQVNNRILTRSRLLVLGLQ